MEAAWLRWNLVGNPSPGGFPGESPDAPRALRSQQAQPIRRSSNTGTGWAYGTVFQLMSPNTPLNHATFRSPLRLHIRLKPSSSLEYVQSQGLLWVCAPPSHLQECTPRLTGSFGGNARVQIVVQRLLVDIVD
ncbi:hypothetical protein ASPNIDRAFT_42037 [Aspergillus niger ATCC 1015]|uniref:Uncharacterized protein n=1 Tax=Aspergillus niger (strain ATCC 1015 / CBS 113.46 / FGSC A1144 / LSHB Ac4 / NCTC 3858a / NRRL 328 / USDA 3528.7) TaxID=380704 RepID=G3XWJ3_ASPNA|nr:hypothetical protein ASPNIDRAFT_42037 [Aspergillus niger ATCC 1015]